MKSRLLLYAMMMSFHFCLHAQLLTDTDSILMRQEADGFLRLMPSGLQNGQLHAVVSAIAGEPSELERVRNSRNSVSPISENVRTRDFQIEGAAGGKISLRLYYPKDLDSQDLPLLVYFHGGGWTFGSINSCSRFCDAVASLGNTAVLAVDYSLAPERPFPDGLNDCIAAVDYAFAHSAELGIDPKRISVGGDSSGGNLALAAALTRSHSAPPLRSLVLFYPVVRAESDDSESWHRYGSGYGLDSALMDAFNKAYLCNGVSSDDYRVSPAYASDERLTGLPPVLMIGAERDILTSQGQEFAARLHKLGIDITHIILPGTVHLFITVAGQERAFDKSVELTVSFLNQK